MHDRQFIGPFQATANDRPRKAMTLDPRHRSFARYFHYWMVFVALFGSSFIYFQAAAMIRNESSENVSLVAMITLLIVTLSWLAYGVLWHDRILIASGVIATAGAILALTVTIVFFPSYNTGPFLVSQP